MMKCFNACVEADDCRFENVTRVGLYLLYGRRFRGPYLRNVTVSLSVWLSIRLVGAHKSRTEDRKNLKLEKK